MDSSKIALLIYSFVFFVLLFSMKGQKDFRESKTDGYFMFEEMKKFSNYYLTGWTFMLQLVFVFIALLDESSKMLNLSIQKRLGKIRANIFNTLLFPTTLVVVSIFWGLWHINRELIFPKVLDEFFPIWLNHALHTFTLVPLVIELLLPKKDNFVEFRKAAPVLAIYFTIYSLLYFSVYLRHGVWLYPIFRSMNWPQRAMFLMVAFVLNFIYQKIGISIQNSKKPVNMKKIKG